VASLAAIGFRAHSGWAAAVAIAGRRDAPAVVTRRRIEMGLAQPYHASVGLELREAQRIVEGSAARAAAMATAALSGLIEDLRGLGHEAAGCGLLLASGRPLPPLERILASHPLLHTAEGEMFREALRTASRACSLPLTAVKERELFTRAAAVLRIPALQIERHVAALGKAIGPPWRQDEKLAAAAAWLALGAR